MVRCFANAAWSYGAVYVLMLFTAARGLSLFEGDVSSSRREWFSKATSAALVSSAPIIGGHSEANALDELPSFVRPLTKLAPLGKEIVSTTKTRNLTLEQIAARLSNDLRFGAHNQGSYFLTGDLSTDLFRDDCIFEDPTNRVSSLSRYQNALRILFDPSQSRLDLIKPLQVDVEESTIRGTIRSRGVLQLPWHPRISAYESDIVYTVDPTDGLISNQRQTWTKSATRALQESFLPGIFVAPTGIKTVPADEPQQVTKLFDYINGRRPNEYTQEERFELAALIQSVCDLRVEWKRNLLPGKWVLAYLQPGPEGGGIDRRITFIDLDFNDNYQIFGQDSITNVGEVFGPFVSVKVSGTLQEEDESSAKVPKRLHANIDGGKLCISSSNCLPLPISGEGIFDGMYLGERIRIGQNINGGGARVVQIRVT